MHPATHAKTHPDRAAYIMAGSGETVTYAEYEARTNLLAHLLRAHGVEVSGRSDDEECVYFEDPDGHQLQVVPAE